MMISFKRTPLIVFVLFATLLLGACKEESPNTIRFGLASLPTNLDPMYATDAASSRIGRLLFQRLVDFDDAKMPIAAIADWQQLTPLHYRFTLNNKVNNFHNGLPLTSADVKATYAFILDKKNASTHRAALALVERMETPDRNTIDFYLTREDPLFPGYLVIGIVPKNLLAAKHNFSSSPIGSGAFRFVDKSDEGKLTLQRMKDKLAVEFIHVPNPTVRVLKLQRGEIDIAQNDLLPELVNYISELDDVEVTKMKGSNFKYIGFNMEDSALKHIEIRRAIAYGIDRKAIIKYVFGDSARNAEALFPPDHWAGNPELHGYEYNPQEAIALLETQGYSLQNPLELTYKTSNNPLGVRLATIYQQQLAQVGIHLDIRSYDWGTFYGDIKSGRFQLYSLAWIGIKTPDIFRYTTHSKAVPPNGANRGRYIDAQVDALIEQAEAISDLNEQAKIYRRLQAYLLQDLPYIPLWYEDHIVATRNNVKNYKLNSDGNYDGLLTVSL